MNRSRSVMVRVPEEMYNRVKELVDAGFYRSIADFFYFSERKELERVEEKVFIMKNSREED